MARLNFKKYIYLLVVLLLLVFFHYSRIFDPLETFLSKNLSPLMGQFYAFSSKLSQTYAERADKKDLAGRLEEAEKKVSQLTGENAKLRFLEEENAELRRNLNFLEKEKPHFLMANIISRGGLANNTGDNQVVIIDRGLKDGLSPGLAAVSSFASGTSSQGVVIGKVVNVQDNIAEVYLVTNKNCKLAATILGETKTAGIAQGELGLVVNMGFIPQTENIKDGDLVATSGLEKNIPRGLVIGRVTKVTKENNEVWQSAAIEPQINLDSLTIVAILLP